MHRFLVIANQEKQIISMKTLLNEVAIRFWSANLKSKQHSGDGSVVRRLTINLRVSCFRTSCLFTTSTRDMQCDKSHQLSEMPAKETTICIWSYQEEG